MKEEFINFVKALMEAAPEVVAKEMNDSVKQYLEILMTQETEKPILTDNGKLVLGFMQKSTSASFKAKDIAEELFISSRSVSGSLRKLVNDGFAEKIGADPVIYVITEKGKNFIID